jgi:DNA polymerase III subunit alpha
MADRPVTIDPIRAAMRAAGGQPQGAEGREPFINLRVHSAYSLLEGALHIKDIVARCVADGSPAVAIADTSNLFGALQFAEAAKSAGVQPIIGCDIDLRWPDGLAAPEPDHGRPPPRMGMVFLAASKTGYDNLVALASELHLQAHHGHSAALNLDFGSLQRRAEGIICLTGGEHGPVGAALKSGQDHLAQARMAALKQLFGDRLYVELQRQRGYDKAVERRMVEIAHALELPLVAVNEAFFAEPADHEAHDALLAIAEGQVVASDDRRRLTPDHCLKRQGDMRALFADLPEAIASTSEIARRCSFFPKSRDPILPRFVGGPAIDEAAALAAEAAELALQAHDGLTMRLNSVGMVEGFAESDYRERLDFELAVITKMKFPGYFLIVADFIQWAKRQGIPVGPGRGSGAGSLVAYALTITDIDPLRFSLLFERFLNPDRVSMPDFDIDFCQDRRDEVIAYVQRKYGRDQVAQIITFGTLQARAVLRDTGRVLQMPYGQVDKLCKMVPNNPANPTPLAKAVADEPRFADEVAREPIVGKLLDIAQKLEGLYRHASTHAAGIVIGDRPLAELVPMYRDPRSDMPVTQFNMKWVEKAGLVKFDFLGLKTLSVLETAVRLIARKGVVVDLATLPLDDKATYEMLSRGETVGVFQVESAGMRKALIGMKPDRIEDIIALVALYRPGPMENIPTYNARKNGEEELASIHPKIDHLLAETQGVIVYQEQVMQIAQELAGYSLGEADLLRRAMGKKIRAEMEVQRERFLSGAVERGVGKAQANTIFDLLAKFADYGFNKSHAAAYAVVSYQTAFLKAHHPVEFLAASMSYDLLNTDKLNDFRAEAERLGIEVVPPSVMTSHARFEVAPGRIFYALAAIKGIGEGAVEEIVRARNEKPFASLADFCTRVDPRLVNKRVYESLIASGALDAFGEERSAMFEGVDRLSGLSARSHDNAASGQGDIFSLGGASGVASALTLPAVQPWLPAEKLKREFDAVGFYLSAHPLDQYRTFLERRQIRSHAEFVDSVRRGVTAGRVAGTVIARQERRTRTGNKMGIVTLSDASGQYEAVLFSEGLAQFRDTLEPGRAVVLMVSADERPEGIGLRIQAAESLEQMAASAQHALRIYVRDEKPLDAILSRLGKGGRSEVSLVMIRDGGAREIELLLPERYAVTPAVQGAVRAVSGVVEAELV